MAKRSRSDVVVPLLALVFFATYCAIGYVWATKTHALTYMDLLFQSDCPRVVNNMTSFAHGQGRTLVHPLHVLLTAPVGVVLSALLGSPALAATTITAAIATFTLAILDTIMRERLRLPLFDRVMFAILLGGSGAYATFGSVPETHVLSALGMSLMALHLSRATAGGVTKEARGPAGWADAARYLGFGWAVLAAGSLITNLLAVPGYVLLQLSGRMRLLRRVATAAVYCVAVLSVIVAMRGAQRALGTEAVAFATDAEAAIEPADAPTQAESGLRARWKGEMANLGQHPILARATAVASSLLVFNLFVPHVHKVPNPSEPEMPRTQLDYLAFDLRPAAVLGSIAWLALIALTLASIGRRNQLRALAREPVVLLGAGLTSFYFLIFCVYGDDLFLFSPNLVLPLMLVVVTAYTRSLAEASPAIKNFHRSALVVAALSALVNSSIHVRDLLAPYV